MMEDTAFIGTEVPRITPERKNAVSTFTFTLRNVLMYDLSDLMACFSQVCFKNDVSVAWKFDTDHVVPCQRPIRFYRVSIELRGPINLGYREWLEHACSVNNRDRMDWLKRLFRRPERMASRVV